MAPEWLHLLVSVDCSTASSICTVSDLHNGSTVLTPEHRMGMTGLHRGQDCVSQPCAACVFSSPEDTVVEQLYGSEHARSTALCT